MEEAVIVAGVRTPVGKFQGGLAPLSAPRLGAVAVREAVRRAGLEPQEIDECIMGNVVQAGLGQNPARQAALFAGLEPRVAALTINKVCGSGLKAVALAKGLTTFAKADAAVIMRMNPQTGQRDAIPVHLKKIEDRKADDVPMKSDDILYVPDSAGKKALARGTEAALGVGTALAVYRVP